MSPRSLEVDDSPALAASLGRMWSRLGIAVRDARLGRHWSVADLARRANVSIGTLYRLESGMSVSSEAATRIAHGLGRRLEIQLVDPRRRQRDARPELGSDLVHSAMGEFEAAQLRKHGHRIGIDEPYQHYQFAGRADVVAWAFGARALLHIENRTRFPDLQEFAGSYNAKRAYLAAALGERLGVRRWASETHVVAALWSSEVLHAVRLREQSFRALCPDPPDSFAAWWSGTPPGDGDTSALVVMDPFASGRERSFVGLEAAMTVRPRHRGYAAAAALLGGS